MQYLKVDTALGICMIEYQAMPPLVNRIRLPGTGKGANCSLSVRGSGQADEQVDEKVPREILEIAESLRRYFAHGETPAVPWACLNMAQLTPNQRQLLREVAKIPGGTVQTYGAVARLAGFSGAARFAGNALAKNPFPVLIPCHRVIRADGDIGGFGGGRAMKQKMIDLEKA
ncbi:MAG: MGMT family protein [Thermodesulfobacteriota bacterium]|nr:MGMT family protein [Thermodesulfobacteriota bacterium]